MEVQLGQRGQASIYLSLHISGMYMYRLIHQYYHGHQCLTRSQLEFGGRPMKDQAECVSCVVDWVYSSLTSLGRDSS
jgi:hypothetical protein